MYWFIIWAAYSNQCARHAGHYHNFHRAKDEVPSWTGPVHPCDRQLTGAMRPLSSFRSFVLEGSISSLLCLCFSLFSCIIALVGSSILLPCKCSGVAENQAASPIVLSDCYLLWTDFYLENKKYQSIPASVSSCLWSLNHNHGTDKLLQFTWPTCLWTETRDLCGNPWWHGENMETPHKPKFKPMTSHCEVTLHCATTVPPTSLHV